jgi:hypothetical protein
MFVGRKPMTEIHRREMLRVILGGAVIATAGLALMPVPAESAPLTMSKSLLPATTENLVQEAVAVMHRGRRRGVLVARGTSSVPLAQRMKARLVGGD